MLICNTQTIRRCSPPYHVTQSYNANWNHFIIWPLDIKSLCEFWPQCDSSMKLELGKLRIIAATSKLYPLFPRSPFMPLLFPVMNPTFNSHSLNFQSYHCSHYCFVSLFSINIFMFLIGLNLFEKNKQSMLIKNYINFVFYFYKCFLYYWCVHNQTSYYRFLKNIYLHLLRMGWLHGISDSMDVSLSGLREMVMDREPGVLRFMGLQRVGHDWATELKGTAYFCQK